MIYATDLIKIHLGDQSDAKVLLGSYVVTDIPGQFRWVPGALTTAVAEGRWIVVEDIDLAPNEVLSVLIPLLEKRELFIPGRGEVIPAAPGFQIFATQTVSDAHGSNSRQTTTGLLSNYWTRVFVEPLSSEELHGVVLTGFPSLALLVPKMIETFDILQLLRDTKVNPQLAPPAIQAGFANAGAVPNLSLLRLGRFISTRDLMKWCRRVAGLVGATLTDSNAKHVASRIRELAFIEAVDCFAGAIQSDALRDFIVFVIAHCWELSSDRVIHLLRQEKPSVHAAPTTFNIGRASLPVNNPDQVRQFNTV
jgi:midasin